MGSAAETRRRLTDQGRLAFAAKGHDGVSLHKDILEPSGVSTGSFYHQFADKTELLIDILDQASEVARTAMAAPPIETQRPSTDVFAPARKTFELWFDVIDRGEDLFRISLRERDSSDARVRKLVKRLQDDWTGSIETNLRTRLGDLDLQDQLPTVSKAVTALGTGLLMQYLDTPKRRRKDFRTSMVEVLSWFTVGGLIEISHQVQHAE